MLAALAFSLSAPAFTARAAVNEAETALVQPQTTLPDVDEEDYLLLTLEKGSYLLGDALEAYRLTSGGFCVDLAQMMAALDFPVEVDDRTGTASGWSLRESNRFVLTTSTVSYGSNEDRIKDGDLYRHTGGLCVESDALSRWFGLTLTPKFAEARMRLDTAEKLPVELAAERQRMRAGLGESKKREELLATLPERTAPYALWRTPSVDLVASLGATRDGKQADIEGIARYALYSAGEAAKLSYDARLSSDGEGIPQALRVRAFRQDANGQLFGPLGATEAVIGDVRTTSNGLISTSAAGRGVWLTNMPLTRASDFDVTALYGELPLGWEAELYRNSALIAFTEPGETGRYAFEDIPLLYGENRFEVRLFGPQGQERREIFIRRVGDEAVPSGETWYRAGAVEDGRDLVVITRDRIGATPLQAVIGAEHGVSKSLSAGLAAHAVEDERGRIRAYLEVSATKSIAGAAIDLDAVRGLSGGTAIGARISGRQNRTSYFASSAFQQGISTDQIATNTRSLHEVRAIHDASTDDRTLVLSATARHRQNRIGNDISEGSGQIASRIAGLSVSQEIGWQQSSGVAGSLGEVTGRTQLGGRIRKISLRGEARYRLLGGAELDEARLTATYRLNDRGMLRGEATYDPNQRLGAFTAGYAQRFERFAVGAEIEADTDSGLAAGVNLAMSFGPGPKGGFVNVSADKLAARGQAAARVFTDLNGDSRWQKDEPVHEGVRIAADRRSTRAETNADGAALVAGLTTGKKTILKIDAASLDDPLLLPATEGIVIVPRRGIAMPVDLPLTPTGEVEGTLFRDGAPLAGALLQLITTDGSVAAVTKTDFDGFILFEMVRYGRYTLRLAPESAAIVGHDQPLAEGVVIDNDEPISNLGSVGFSSSRAPKMVIVDPVDSAAD